MERIPDEKTAEDAAHEVGRAILSAIPLAGGPLQVLFENVFAAPLERRKQAWLEELAGAVSELQARIDGLQPKDLSNSDTFITVALRASQIAIRNHQRAKLEALRNAVVNSVLPNAPTEDEQSIFLGLVDDLTPWHLVLLTFLNNPVQWLALHEIADPGPDVVPSSTVLEYCFPDLAGKRDLYEQMLRDLQTEGLLAPGEYLNSTVTGMMEQTRTSGLGKRFLEFISEPGTLDI